MASNEKRSASKDWPYEDDGPMYRPAPGYYWECPDGTCQCHPLEEGEPLELTVLLCDERARPMPNARCLVLHAGRVLNEHAPNADADGWLDVTVTCPLRTVTLEWAPPDTPLVPRFPFRWRYHVDVEEEASDRHALTRRLHNLGFSGRGTLEDHVKDFQRAFDYEEITGDPEDIREDLLAFHDDGGIPPLEDEREPEVDGISPGSGVSFMAFPAAKDAGTEKQKTPKKGKKKAVPRNPPPPKNKPAGGAPGKGTARPRARANLTLLVRSQFSQPATAVATSFRWDGKTSHPVVDALVEVRDAKGHILPVFTKEKKPPRTGKTGEVTLQIGSLPDGEYVLKLNPPPGHELRPTPLGPIADPLREALLRPVGPGDNFPDDPAGHTRFRFLEMRITLKKGVMVQEETRLGKGMHHPDATVAHSAVVNKHESFLLVDWKPDWVRCGFVKGPKQPQTVPNLPSEDGGPAERLLSPMEFILLHHAAAKEPGSVISQFLSTKFGAHYLVDVDGHVIKLNPESVSTRHAGRCFWYGLESVDGGFNWNDVSIGIEQVHDGTDPYPNDLIAGTKNLIQRLRTAFPNSHHNVLGHGEIALHEKGIKRLGRKFPCPGEQYNWPFLESAGNATKPVAGSGVVMPHARYGNFFLQFPDASINTFHGDRALVRAAVAGLQLTLSQLGYFVAFTDDYDEPTIRAVEAFQVRYFSGDLRKGDRRQLMHNGKRLANLITVKQMHAVLAARRMPDGSIFRF